MNAFGRRRRWILALVLSIGAMGGFVGLQGYGSAAHTAGPGMPPPPPPMVIVVH